MFFFRMDMKPPGSEIRDETPLENGGLNGTGV
jgi:hypothetical protein